MQPDASLRETVLAAEGPISFATLIAAASRRGETAIAYRRALAGGRGLTLNPAKSAVFPVAPGDRLIVLAEG